MMQDIPQGCAFAPRLPRGDAYLSKRSADVLPVGGATGEVLAVFG